MTYTSPAISGTDILVQNIVITGNKRTRKRTILNELTFKAGKTITKEDIDDSWQNLMNMELFSKVVISTIDADPAIKGVATIEIKVREKWSYFPLPQYTRTSDAEIRLGFIYQDYNLMGRGNYLKLKWLRKWADDFDDYIGDEYSLNLRAINLFRDDSVLSTRLGRDKDLKRNYLNGDLKSTYREISESYSIGINKPYDNYRAGIGYATSSFNYEHLSGRIEPYSDLKVNAVAISIGYDIINNVGDYTYEGFSLYLSNSKSDKKIGSDLNSTTYSIKFNHFIKLAARKNIAYRVKGAIRYGGQAEQSSLSVGGSTSIRGYEKGEYTGDRMFQFNSEYRFPISERSWGGVLFIDSGYAWQKDESAKAQDLKWSAGIGLRLFIKKLVKGVGRIDYAYNLARDEKKTYVGVHHSF